MKRLLVPFATGFLGGCLFLTALLVMDVGGLGTLVARDREMVLPVVLLALQLGGVFGVAAAVSIVPEPEAPGGGRLQLRTIPVRVSAGVRKPLSPNR